MKITVINGTEKHGVTYRLKESFLDCFRDSAQITEFYLPKDCPNFCAGCTVCFLNDEHKCKDAEYIQKIERAMIITQCLGAGGKSTAKDIRDSLSWWGISDIRVCSFKLMSDINWNNIPEKKRLAMTGSLKKAAQKLLAVDYSRPAHTKLATKMKFYIIRMMQTGLGKQDPEYTDYKYWKANGWIDKKRPWKK